MQIRMYTSCQKHAKDTCKCAFIRIYSYTKGIFNMVLAGYVLSILIYMHRIENVYLFVYDYLLF